MPMLRSTSYVKFTAPDSLKCVQESRSIYQINVIEYMCKPVNIMGSNIGIFIFVMLDDQRRAGTGGPFSTLSESHTLRQKIKKYRFVEIENKNK